MNRSRSILKWLLVSFLAIALTAIALVYQSFTGPTKPLRTELRLSHEIVYHLKLPRSHGGISDCPVVVEIPDESVSADLFFRRYPTSDEWQKVTLQRDGSMLRASLPNQPPAGKLEYHIVFSKNGNAIRQPSSGQAIIRFRGDVPAGIILPHVILMFVAMLLSNLTLFLALFGFKQQKVFGWVTLTALVVGGLIFGPLVQKHAFGEFWTGFPNGMDLTDNKTLIAFVFWLMAVIANIKKERRYLTVLASIIMLVIFSIPHSARGSELNPETGKIETGMIVTPRF